MKLFSSFALALAVSAAVAASGALKDDWELWNDAVGDYESGAATNALPVLEALAAKPGANRAERDRAARAAELAAAIRFERAKAATGAAKAEELERAATLAQEAMRADPKNERRNRNFTRATDRLPELRREARAELIAKVAQGKDPGTLLADGVKESRALLKEAATYRTNVAEVAIAKADAAAVRARRLSEIWPPVGEAVAQAITNELEAATLRERLGEAEKKTLAAATAFEDFDVSAYSLIADAEQDFTRYYKMCALPPMAIAEDLTSQSNAWLDIETVNDRAWQQDALDYTRAFRAQFPAWAQAYEQQAEADTNMAPFTAEAQAEISALSTELEKLQIECVKETLPPKQQEAIGIIEKIAKLLPPQKGGGGQGGGQNSEQNQQQKNNQNQQNEQQEDPQNQPNEPEANENEAEKKDESQSGEEPKDEDKSVEAILRKAQERSDEHEAEKKARMRKTKLPPSERDW